VPLIRDQLVLSYIVVAQWRLQKRKFLIIGGQRLCSSALLKTVPLIRDQLVRSYRIVVVAVEIVETEVTDNC
jgi:hypothetical protein